MGSSAAYYLARKRLDDLDTVLGETAAALDDLADRLAYCPAKADLASLPDPHELQTLIASREQARAEVEQVWYGLSSSDRKAVGPPPGDLARDPTRPVV